MASPQPAPLAVPCPTCGANLRVPAALAGKTVKCKACATAFKVPLAPATARPLPPGPAKPATAKPPAPPPADAPLKLADDDDDEEGGKYGVQADDLDIPRCPRCAKELDPPDTKICLNCGYDLLARVRHESRTVYEHTTGDYVRHLGPGVASFLSGAAVLGGAIFCSLRMRGWLTGSLLDREEKNKLTDKQEFYVEPFCFNVWLLLFGIFVFWKAGKFAYKRLFINWRPPEIRKKD